MKKKINSLDIDEGLKRTLEKVFLNEEGEKGNFKITAITNSESEDESENFEESEAESEQSENGCEGNCEYYKTLCQANGLCVLTKEDNFILDLIDQITDPVTKREMLQKYLEQYNTKKSEKGLKFKESETYSLKEILNRAKSSIERNSSTESV